MIAHAFDSTTATEAQLQDKQLQIDAGQGERMMATVEKFIAKFVAYPSEHARVAHALWIVHAHMMECWDSTPRLAFLSPEPASGKTRALEVTELLVPRPMEAVNMSPSALFRSVGSEEGLPTVLFDEIDTLFGAKAKEHEEVRGLLNAGHRRGAKTYRSVIHGKAIEVEAIEAFSAVALAGLGWLPATIMSRSVIIRMRRRHQDERVEQFRRRIFLSQGTRIRSMIELWARASAPEVTWPDLPAEIQDRDADVWEPLIMIADAVGGDWPTRARVAAVALVSESKESEPSLGIRLLADLRTVFGDENEMASKAILLALQALPESPWGDLKGKSLDERGLAHRLRQYGVKSKTIRVGDATPKGYRREDLYECWGRYLPVAAGSATTATSETSPLNQRETVADDVADSIGQAQQKTLNNISLVSDVADVADLPEEADDLEIPKFLDRRGRAPVSTSLCTEDDLAFMTGDDFK